MQSFGKEEEKLLRFIESLPLQYIKAFDVQTDQYIQNKQSQINAFRVLEDNWDKVLDDEQVLRLAPKSLESLIGYMLSVDAEPSVMRHIVATGFVGKDSTFEKKVFNDLDTFFHAKEKVNLTKIIARLQARLQWINPNQIGYKNHVYSNTLSVLRARVLNKISGYIDSITDLDGVIAIENMLASVFDRDHWDETLQTLVRQKRQKLLKPANGILSKFKERTTAELENAAAILSYKNVISFLLDQEFPEQNGNFLEHIIQKINVLSSMSFVDNTVFALPGEKEKMQAAKEKAQEEFEVESFR